MACSARSAFSCATAWRPDPASIMENLKTWQGNRKVVNCSQLSTWRASVSGSVGQHTDPQGRPHARHVGGCVVQGGREQRKPQRLLQRVGTPSVGRAASAGNACISVGNARPQRLGGSGVWGSAPCQRRMIHGPIPARSVYRKLPARDLSAWPLRGVARPSLCRVRGPGMPIPPLRALKDNRTHRTP